MRFSTSAQIAASSDKKYDDVCKFFVSFTFRKSTFYRTLYDTLVSARVNRRSQSKQ